MQWSHIKQISYDHSCDCSLLDQSDNTKINLKFKDFGRTFPGNFSDIFLSGMEITHFQTQDKTFDTTKYLPDNFKHQTSCHQILTVS